MSQLHACHYEDTTMRMHKSREPAIVFNIFAVVIAIELSVHSLDSRITNNVPFWLSTAILLYLLECDIMSSLFQDMLSYPHCIYCAGYSIRSGSGKSLKSPTC